MKPFNRSVSASMIHLWQNCPRAFYYSYVLQLMNEIVSANLPFGSCVHEATTGYIIAAVKGAPYDRVQVFVEAWNNAINSRPIEFSSVWDHEAMKATGIKLVELFAQRWESLNLFPLLDEKGEPMVERPLRARLPNGIELYGIQDCVAMDLDAKVAIVDIKTPAASSPEGFVELADQFTHYQILNESNRDSLGIDQVDKLGFFELIKRKVPKAGGHGKGPQIEGVEWSPRRSDRAVAEFCDKVEWMMDDINRGRFPKTPRMAWNTPCSMCDYKNLCQNNDKSGLVAKPKSPAIKAA